MDMEKTKKMCVCADPPLQTTMFPTSPATCLNGNPIRTFFEAGYLQHAKYYLKKKKEKRTGQMENDERKCETGSQS